MRRISCGVIVSDGQQLLLGHATRSPRWDIPKGLAETGEDPADAAARELAEETGLHVTPDALIDLGLHRYLPAKDLALFLWRPAALPDPSALHCASSFTTGRGETLPEFDRFGLFTWEEAIARVGRNLARILAEMRASGRVAMSLTRR